MTQREYKKTVRYTYINKINEIVCDVEEKDPHFTADNLLYPIEKNTNIPSLADYFYEQTSAYVQDQA